ncbi:hypothetical protein [Mycobacteroides abscessus]
MKEERDKDMAMSQKDLKKVTASNQKAMASASKMLNKYDKTFKKLAKN